MEPLIRLLRPRTPHYPYDFQTSGFAAVDLVRSWLEDQPDWDIEPDVNLGTKYCIERAALYGFLEPFSNEQTALVNYLLWRSAGPNVMTYAWGLYRDFSKKPPVQPSWFSKKFGQRIIPIPTTSVVSEPNQLSPP